MGFETSQVRIDDPVEVAHTGLTHYQNAVPTNRAGATVSGVRGDRRGTGRRRRLRAPGGVCADRGGLGVGDLGVGLCACEATMSPHRELHRTEHIGWTTSAAKQRPCVSGGRVGRSLFKQSRPAAIATGLFLRPGGGERLVDRRRIVSTGPGVSRVRCCAATPRGALGKQHLGRQQALRHTPRNPNRHGRRSDESRALLTITKPCATTRESYLIRRCAGGRPQGLQATPSRRNVLPPATIRC